MSEQAKTQVRLHHERTCAAIFGDLQAVVGNCPLTLCTFDYGNHEFSSFEFKSTLAPADIAEAFSALIAAWRTGLPRVIDEASAHTLELPGNPCAISAYGDFVKQSLPDGRGFALLFGRGEATQYIATAERDDMIRMLEAEALPFWRGEQR